jgi:hypothetical protein
MSLNQDIEKVREFVQECINNLESGNYAYVCSGYHSGGGKYDGVIQSYADRIVSKLVSLGYKYNTNHGYGCRDWSFYKDFEI